MNALRPLPEREEWGWLGRSLPVLLLAAGIVGSVPVVRSLYVADLNWCYPFLSADGYDWINNGLFWAGAPVLPSFRPPGLPFVIALLRRLDLLSFLPILNVIVLGATAVLLFLLLRERFSSGVSALAAWVFFANGFVQDFVRWILAEIWAIPFLVVAALFFHRAGREPRAYSGFGLALGVGFLFHYAALPAAVGFAASVLLFRRADLRLRSFWTGTALAAIPPLLWLAFRWRWSRLHPEVVPHDVEALLRFTPSNVPFFLFAGTALLGLALLPLYAGGAVRLLRPDADPGSLLRRTFLPPLVTLGLFFGLLYDWTDKRFLLYLFPFVLGFLALGIEGLLSFCRKSPFHAAAGTAYLLVALGWNQIAYPPYGIRFLAITPAEFLEAPDRTNARGKMTLAFWRAKRTRVHGTVGDAFLGGLFDFRLRPYGCPLDGPAYCRLPELKWKLDSRLGPGVPIGMEGLPGWPEYYWANVNRMSNILERPVVRPDLAPCFIAPGPKAGLKEIIAAGPYSVDCWQ